MKEFRLALIPLTLALSLSVTAAAAADHATMAVQTGVLFLSESHSGGAPLSGLRGGYALEGKGAGDSLGLEGVLLHGSDPEIQIARLDLLYTLVRKERWRWFLTLGLGGYLLDAQGKPLAAGGMALAFQPDSPLFLRLDSRYLREIGIDEQGGWEFGLNFGYQFGYQRKPRPKPAADTDGDGVPDRSDRCPETPKELKIDRYGCPVNPPDEDRDRVPDYLDSCPGTEKGMQVEPDGCPPDRDRDGVPDVRDACPDTPPVMPIGADGCVEVREDGKVDPASGVPAL